jgi:hypothetical protein
MDETQEAPVVLSYGPDWMQTEEAKASYALYKVAHPDLTDTQLWEMVYSRLDPMGGQ